jgi:hypothetical protein
MEDSGTRAVSRGTLREWVLCVGLFYISTQNLTGYDAGGRTTWQFVKKMNKFRVLGRNQEAQLQ